MKVLIFTALAAIGIANHANASDQTALQDCNSKVMLEIGGEATNSHDFAEIVLNDFESLMTGISICNAKFSDDETDVETLRKMTQEYLLAQFKTPVIDYNGKLKNSPLAN